MDKRRTNQARLKDAADVVGALLVMPFFPKVGARFTQAVPNLVNMIIRNRSIH
jgi:hypothetical protein